MDDPARERLLSESVRLLGENLFDGLAAPGAYAERVLDDAGRLSRLSQGGWSIDYGRYRETAGVGLPVKMLATREDWKVKLAVRGWNLGAADAQR